MSIETRISPTTAPKGLYSEDPGTYEEARIHCPEMGVTLYLSWDAGEPEYSIPAEMSTPWLTCHGHDQVQALEDVTSWIEYAEIAASNGIPAAEEFCDEVRWCLPSHMQTIDFCCVLELPGLIQQARLARARGDVREAHRLTLKAGQGG